MKFEIVSKYADAGLNLPVRKTKASAGYDFQAAENILIPSYFSEMNELAAAQITSEFCDDEFLTLEKVSALTKQTGIKPTLIPTGIKCEMPEEMYLELSVRSSCPLKHWLVLANGVGVIDADYYNNQDNEGHIYFQVINLSPFDILIQKGDTIGQGIFKRYYLTDEDTTIAERKGGFGSTDQKFTINKILNATVYDKNGKCGTLTDIEPMEEECVMACNPLGKAFVFEAPKETFNG